MRAQDVEWRAKRWLLAAAKPFLRSVPLPAREVPWSDARRVLVLRPLEGLGDTVASTAALRGLCRACPRARVDLFIREDQAPLFEGSPELGRLWVFDRARFRRAPWGLAAMVRAMRRERYDVAMLLSRSFSSTCAWLAYASGARVRIGCESASYGYPGLSGALLTTVLEPPDESRHEARRILSLLQAVGLEASDERHYLWVDPAERTLMEDRLEGMGFSPDRPLIALFPGANWPFKRWPEAKFAELAGRLQADGYQVVLTVGPREEEIESHVRRHLSAPAPFLPPLPLKALKAFCASVEVAVCNDTGLLHVAAASGASTVGIFGPEDPAIWNPLGEGHVALRGADGRCASVEVEEVRRRVVDLAGSPAGEAPPSQSSGDHEAPEARR